MKFKLVQYSLLKMIEKLSVFEENSGGGIDQQADSSKICKLQKLYMYLFFRFRGIKLIRRVLRGMCVFLYLTSLISKILKYNFPNLLSYIFFIIQITLNKGIHEA